MLVSPHKKSIRVEPVVVDLLLKLEFRPIRFPSFPVVIAHQRLHKGISIVGSSNLFVSDAQCSEV